MLSMLADVINYTFEKECGKHQLSREDSVKAFKVTFRLRTTEVEEGYRNLDVIWWGPQNYVQVWACERYDVISVLDMDYNDDGDGTPKPGKKYSKGDYGWYKVSDHDSGWRDGLNRILKENEKKINGLNSRNGTFYEIVDARTLPFTGYSP